MFMCLYHDLQKEESLLNATISTVNESCVLVQTPGQSCGETQRTRTLETSWMTFPQAF